MRGIRQVLTEVATAPFFRPQILFLIVIARLLQVYRICIFQTALIYCVYFEGGC